MTCGFTDDYLQTRKLTNQKTKRGENSNRKEMHEADIRRILRKLKSITTIEQLSIIITTITITTKTIITITNI